MPEFKLVDEAGTWAFDVLALDGEPTLRLPYVERHALLEEIVVEGPPALLEIVASFDDGPALWDAVVARGLEGRRRETRARAVPSGCAAVGQDEEQCDSEVPGGTRRRAAPPRRPKAENNRGLIQTAWVLLGTGGYTDLVSARHRIPVSK